MFKPKVFHIQYRFLSRTNLKFLIISQENESYDSYVIYLMQNRFKILYDMDHMMICILSLVQDYCQSFQVTLVKREIQNS